MPKVFMNSEELGLQDEAGLLHQDAVQEQDTNKPTLLGLSAELRLLIYPHILITERPFLIGRCQEVDEEIQGSPRGMYPWCCDGPPPVRDDSRNRPIQPFITRVCHLIRNESLSFWYGVNRFWLIHNEFDPNPWSPERSSPRRFEAWISQTPPCMFEFMRHVSICGYVNRTNRLMISIDLSKRQLITIRCYSPYGHGLENKSPDYEYRIKQAFEETADSGAREALKTVIAIAEEKGLFHIVRRRMTASTRPRGLGEPQSGWDYDW